MAINFIDQLKLQLTDFTDSYKKYFTKTFAVAMAFTVISLVASALAVKVDAALQGVRLDNLLSLFFYRYSFTSYQLIDLAALFTWFFISVFSIQLFRHDKRETELPEEFSFSRFIENIKGKDIIVLFLVLLVAAVIDLGLFDIYKFIAPTEGALRTYLYYFFTHLRKYVPPLLFAVAIHWLTNDGELNVNLKELLFLFISIWLFNVVAFEFYTLIRVTVFDLILLHFANAELLIFYQSILSIPLMGVLFVGYYSAMTWWLRTDEVNPVGDHSEETVVVEAP